MDLTANLTSEQPVALATERTPEKLEASTVEQTPEQLVTSAAEQTSEQPVASTVKQTPERSVASTVEQTPEQPVASAAEQTLEQPVALAADRMPEQSVALATERTPEKLVASAADPMADLPVDLRKKYEKLQQLLRELGSVAVAFSSGVDSTFLLKAAADTLGERVIAVTAGAPSFPKRETEEAGRFCEEQGITQIPFWFDQWGVPGFQQNPPNRCYLCKRGLFEKIKEIADAHQMAAVVEGSNVDDEGDYRPGMQAIEELGVRSPLREARLTKAEIRILSRQLGLPTWKKPSFACLASRIVYGETIDEKKLQMVDQAEQFLLDLGFRQVRVRLHGMMARIEVLAEEITKLLDEEVRSQIVAAFREAGFTYVTLDLSGYRSGSMNEVLTRRS